MTRTEAFGIAFKDELAEGWVLGVPEAFRGQLDILYLQDIDKEMTEKLRKKHPESEDGTLPTIYRMRWSRGVPPSLSFDVGHIFYNPPEARRMIWTDALKVLRQTVQVTAAQADELTGSGGWVKIELRHFEDGKAVRTEKHDFSQANFEAFLRTGQLPLGR